MRTTQPGVCLLLLLACTSYALPRESSAQEICVIEVSLQGLHNLNESVGPSPFNPSRLAAIANDGACSFALLKVAPQGVQGPQRPASNAVLLAVDQTYFLQSFEDYWPNTLTKVAYCYLHNYDCLVYVHRQELPGTHPPHFTKVAGINTTLFTLNYEHVLFTDWDAWISGTSAIMFESFLAPHPHASLILQGEEDLCTCIMIYRRTLWARQFLQTWWDAAYTGCCKAGTFDQIAFRHVLGAALATASGDRELYNPDDQKWKSGIQVLNMVNIAHILSLKNTSFLGLVTLRDDGMVHHDKGVPIKVGTNAVQLHNCLGLWKGCIHHRLPTLLYHHGHGNKKKYSGLHIGKDMRALTGMALLRQAY